MAKVIATVEKAGNELTLQQNGSQFQHRLRIDKGMGIYPGIVVLRKTKKAGLHLFFDCLQDRGKSYSLPITKDGAYNLTPTYGYRVRPPEEEKNPLKRVLREDKLSIRIIEQVSVSREVLLRHYLRNDSLIYERVLTNGRLIIGRPPRISVSVRGGSFAILFLCKDSVNGSERKTLEQRILKVVVRSDCNPNTLRKALRSIKANRPVEKYHAQDIGARVY